jgi:drug/metabolite transporter (DMT)-like permease
VPASSPRSPLAPQLALLAMNAIWGVSFTVTKTALDAGMPKFALIGARFWLALLCLLPFLPRGRAAASLRVARRPGLITGTALFAGYALQTFGIDLTSPSIGGFLTGLIVLLVALGAHFVLGDRLRPRAISGLLLSFVGLCLLCFAAATGADRATTLPGILLQVGSSTVYAVHVLLISRISPAGDELAYSWWQLFVVAAGALVLAPVTGGAGPLDSYAARPLVWGSVAYLGVLATALGIAVQSRVQPRIRPSQVAVLFATQPAFAAVAGFLLHDDHLDGWQWLGGALIVVGVLVASRGSRGSEPGAHSAAPSTAPQPSR